MIDEMEKYHVVYGMTKIGGSFIIKLGEAIRAADPSNTLKIKQTFPEYWEEYLNMGKKLHDKNEEKWRKRST